MSNLTSLLRVGVPPHNIPVLAESAGLCLFRLKFANNADEAFPNHTTVVSSDPLLPLIIELKICCAGASGLSTYV